MSSITTYEIPVHLKQLITPNQAFHYRIIPFAKDENSIHFKSDTKDIIGLQKELTIILGCRITIIDETTEHIQSYLTFNYRKATTASTEKLRYEDQFLQKLIATAKDFGSSDIHMEPYEKICRVRFRLDGKLKEQYTIAKTEYPQLVNQIKIQSGLDISQKRLAQDGRITFKQGTDDFDIRVSTMPTLYGEKIVLRLLNRNTQEVLLTDLGFTQKEIQEYREAIKKPQGIILISGPTGSGKTTTLYATLKELNKETTNILTIEDPIEYTLEGINQVQLREDIEFDFPAALRAFLRQDPDIIMVGEIRDDRTAAMAIKAALTGHLVLSTIHTNSAWATISRLIDMKVPAFLLANTITMSIAQRLVRKLCPHCKTAKNAVSEDFPKHFEIPEELQQHYVATGCDQCYHTGYIGRKAIYEILPITKQLETAIRHNELQIDTYIKENQINTLQYNAIRMVIDGETSVEEVYALLVDN
ncbi:GspE/PulE family protein [Aquimarina algicola]|uniref:Type II/IV secretion system protein n=1 Tax=Aquimarina algicola TaxID=2589995 RepID=A0A504JGZ3_9FLAO|nr:GspE/PulE family protein [Aquimarina algicola]TPN87685.1 type II/IV secretion system protein [Aquimarina algicola]